MKVKLYHLQFIFFSLLGFYPLIKFDWSSKILVVFCILSIIIALRNNRFNFTRENWMRFIVMTGYFLMLLISIIYSSNNGEAFRKIIQFIPLLIIPFIVSFCSFNLSKKKQSFVFNLFICVNVTYTIFISYLFFKNPDRLEFGLNHYLLDYDKFQFIINQNLSNNFFLVHKPYFSMGFVICAIFSLNAFIKNNSKKYFPRLLYLLVFFYFLFWISFAFSFPNVLALFLCIILVLCTELSQKLLFIYSFLFLGISIFIFNIKSEDVDFQRGFNFIRSSINNKEYEVKDTRQEIYKTIDNIIKKNSFSELLFGIGIGDVQDNLNSQYENRLSLNKTKNSLFFSEEFNNQYWFKNNIKVISNKELSSKFKNNADLFIARNLEQNLSHNLSTEIKVVEEGLYTLSVYVKKSNSDNIILRLGEVKQRAVFDVRKGKILQNLNTINAGVEPFEDNWYRCFITVNLKKKGLVVLGLSNNIGDYVYTSSTKQSLFFWGVQLEKGQLTPYVRNYNEQLQLALNEKLNTHNNYLYFLLSIGVIGLLFFLVFIIYLIKISVMPLDIHKLSFCIIVLLNFLTENILSRHWGLMFFSFMLVLLFNKKEKIIKN